MLSGGRESSQEGRFVTQMVDSMQVAEVAANVAAAPGVALLRRSQSSSGESGLSSLQSSENTNIRKKIRTVFSPLHSCRSISEQLLIVFSSRALLFLLG